MNIIKLGILLNEGMLSDFKACGGIITLAVGLKLSNIRSFKVLNILPAIVLVIHNIYIQKMTNFLYINILIILSKNARM